MRNLAIKYLELDTLQGQTKEELINKVLELQQRDKELVEKYKLHIKEIQNYKSHFEELFRVHATNQIITEDYKRIVDLKLGNTYNINDTWINKIVFVLKAAGRSLRSSEIIEVLSKNDLTFRTLTDPQKGLSAHLTKALKYGRIIGTKQKGQNGYVFSLPD
jgi:hypothetical protein